MARAQGARAQMALAYETVYGTPPVSGFRLMPFARATLGSEQPLLESELLGYGRDPLAPIKDAVTADGEVVIPIDVEAFGFWLKAAFGQPVTTGTTVVSRRWWKFIGGVTSGCEQHTNRRREPPRRLRHEGRYQDVGVCATDQRRFA